MNLFPTYIQILKTFRTGFTRNIPIFAFVNFFRWLSLWVSVYMRFYEGIGLDPFQIGLLFSARNIMSLLLEVPSGVFADLFGRKKTIITSIIMQIAGFIIIYLSYGFEMAIFANLVIGGSLAFNSGADSAIIYDSLAIEKKESYFKKVQSFFAGTTGISMIIASVLGGILLKYFDIRILILFNISSYFIALLFSVFLKEPPLKTQNTDKSFIKHAKEALHFVLKNKSVLYIILFGAVMALSYEVSEKLRQLFFAGFGISDSTISIFGAAFLSIAMIAGFFAVFVLKISDRIQLTVSFLIYLIHFFLLSLFFSPGVGFIAISIAMIAKGTLPIFIDSYVNAKTSSHNRATVMSFQSLVENIAVSVVPLFLALVSIFDMRIAFAVTGVFLFILGGVFLLLFSKNRALS